jgi:hypothetical protein
MSARDSDPPRSPPASRTPSSAPSRPAESPRQPVPNRQPAAVVDDAGQRRMLSPAERKIRNANRQIEADKAIAEHERAQRAFYENRARLKAERLARAGSETEVKAQK